VLRARHLREYYFNHEEEGPRMTEQSAPDFEPDDSRDDGVDSQPGSPGGIQDDFGDEEPPTAEEGSG